MRNITPFNIMASHIRKTQSLTTHISPTDELPQLVQNIIEDVENRINYDFTEPLSGREKRRQRRKQERKRK